MLEIILDQFWEMGLAINNIKFGFTIKPPSLYLSKLDYLSEFFEVKRSGNIVTLRTEDFVFIIFTSGHINATGVRSTHLISECVDFFLTIFSLPHKVESIDIRIDNISASTSLNRPSRPAIEVLSKIANRHSGRISFNQESFPGVTINLKYGTIIIFMSCKVNVVGVKRESNLSYLCDIISEIEKS
jgi:TATA-box binding protein (TBP) (component of TFIID and TFIIIB)